MAVAPLMVAASVLAMSAMALSTIGCAGDAGGSAESGVVRRDSAGVEIVENAEGVVARDPRWSIPETPTLDIGAREGDVADRLYLVTGGRRLDDGRIAIVNGGTAEIRFYSSDGAHLHSTGGKGEGPGEFEFPYGLWPVGDDSLAVWDPRLRRLSLFDTRGDFGRAVRPERPAANPHVAGIFADRSFLMWDFRLVVPDAGFEMSFAEFVRYTLDDMSADSAGRFPWALVGRIGEGDVGIVGRPIFAARSVVAVSPRYFWIGTAREYEVGQYAPDGTPVRSIRWQGPDRAVPEGAIERYGDQQVAETEEQYRAAERRRLESMPAAERFPAYEWLEVDRGGYLWVKSYVRPAHEGPVVWWVFSPDGALTATAALPADASILDIGSDFLLLLEPDELDVEHVRMYPMDRGARDEA